MHERLHALVIPALIATVSGIYWFQVSGARKPVILVPSAIIALISLFLVIILVKEMRSPRVPPVTTFSELSKPLSLIGLYFAYYFGFTRIGFSFSNLLFVFFAATLMGVSFYKSLITAIIATFVLFLVSIFLDLNVPSSFWMFS